MMVQECLSLHGNHSHLEIPSFVISLLVPKLEVTFQQLADILMHVFSLSLSVHPLHPSSQKFRAAHIISLLPFYPQVTTL